MKKALMTLTLCFLCVLCIVGFSACHGNNATTDNTKAELISVNGFNIDGQNGKISVSNDTKTYSFINQIQVSDGASWVISTDIYGRQTIATRTIPLNIGDNNVYLLVTSDDGENINLYTLTVRRRPIYTVYFNANEGTIVESQKVEEGSFVIEPTEPKRTGYTFAGWNYDFTKPITNNTTITAQWTYYTLTAGVNNNKAGTTTGFSATKITAGESVTVTATTNAGYTFDGWYNGDYVLTSELNYTFNMPSENIIYIAKWTACTDTPYKVEYYLENSDDDNYTLQINDTENFTGTTDTIVNLAVDKTYNHFTIVKDTVTGNINGDGSTVLKVYYTRNTYTVHFNGNGGELLSGNEEQQIKHQASAVAPIYIKNGNYVSAFDKPLTNITSNTMITATEFDKEYGRDGDFIYFGMYPQSDVTDEMSVLLSYYVNDLPENGNNNGWTSYKYYIYGNNTTDFMWYKDVTYIDGNVYRAVYFTEYRSRLTSSGGNSYQDDNGYETNNVFWFQYEPIKWRILSENDDTVILFADLILDSQNYIHKFNDYSDVNYANSTVRAWLNNTFYNTAFCYAQQEIIVTTMVDNSDSTNKYAVDNTEDKIFLLSLQEAMSAEYGFNTDDTARQKKTSDYAQVQGANTDSVGNGTWWLRSCATVYSQVDYIVPWGVDYSGKLYTYYNGPALSVIDNDVHYTYFGIVPALTLLL